MKILERDKAVELRKEGNTYGEIMKEIPVSKTSLSYWLRDIVLTPGQLARIRYKDDDIKSKFIEYNAVKRHQSIENKFSITEKASKDIGCLSERELKLVGIALYWAGGHKANAHSVDFVNSDPAMIRLMMRWLREVCLVGEKQFRIRLQVHNSSDIEAAKCHWSKITNIPLAQFTKVYTKISPSSKRKFPAKLPYGICAIRVSDVNLITRIQGWIKGLYGAIV